jgi:protocatechuate 3,4-dioxygenase beta subunit
MGEFVRERREAILLLSAAGAAFALGCGGSSPTSPTSTASTGTTTTASGGTGTTNATCSVSPSETAGPFPSLQDLIRSDIREDREGTPLQLTIAVVNVAAGCTPLANVAVEIWQCDVAGGYSQYGSQAARTYLRGIQTTNSAGEVVFTTIYPGWYQGRATHIHVEVARAGQSLKVTQIAFPEDVSNQVHTQGVYASRGVNATTNARDGIFADSVANQMATVTGTPAGSMTATFRVAVSA